MEPAVFSLVDYKFTKASLDFSDIISELNVNFSTRGEYYSQTGEFKLFLDFIAKNNNINSKEVLSVSCESRYKFKENKAIEEIPNYFYANVIAIIYPYIRSFTSTLTLQSNIKPIILPTMNLSSLGEELKNNTKVL